MKFAQNDEIFETLSKQSKYSNETSSVGTLTVSNPSTAKHSPVKPLMLDGFGSERNLSPIKPLSESESQIHMSDVLSHIGQLPQTSQISDVRAV